MSSDISDVGGDEMDMTVEKAFAMISKIISTSEENVPPLVFKVLHLTRAYNQMPMPGNQDNTTVFGHTIQALSKYYNRNHERILNQPEEGTMESVDLIEDEGSSYAFQRSECNVIFHLTHAVKMGHPIGKEILKLLKSSVQLPDVIFANPFNMFVGLAITTIKPHQALATDCIKTAAYKNILLQLKKDESAWFRKTVPHVTDAQKLFAHLIDQSTTFGGWDMIGAGLIDVSMALLDLSYTFAVSKKKVSKILCNLGQEIIRLVTRKRSTSIITVLNELTKRILASKGAVQYTDCLRVTIKGGLIVIMEEPATFINELLDHFGSLGINGAKRVIVALIPLIKHGRSSIRNSTILILRKCLFSPSLDTRRIAVVGVLQLLKYFKITSSLPLTQMIMSQSSSCLSQAAVSVHQGGTTNNEALCLELMGVVKRSLSQQAIVKMTLYQGLHDVVGRNPEICVAVLDMLYSHAVQLKITAEDAANPIDVDSMISIKSDDVFVIEPVGWFLHCIQLMVGKANHIYGDENMAPEEVDTTSLVKLTDLLDRLGNVYADNLDTMDLNFEKGADYSKTTSGGRYNILRAETYKNIYESLMDYAIMRGAGTQINKAGLLTRLQYRHAEMCEFICKRPLTANEKTNKRKGKGKNSKAKDNESLLRIRSTQELNSNSTQNKPENGCKNSFIEAAPHAFSLKAISNILQSILNDNKPSNNAAVSQFRNNAKFVKFFLMVTLERQNQIDKELNISGDGDANDVVLKHLSSIASTLAESCLTNPEADERYLPDTLQCFLTSLKIVSSHFSRNEAAIDSFYGYIYSNARGFSRKARSSSTQILPEIVNKLIDKINSLLERYSSQNEDDLEEALKKNTMDGYVQLLIFLCKEIDVTDSDGAETAKKATQWVKNVIENCKIDKIDTLTLVLELFYTCYLRTKSSDTTIIKELSQEIHSKIGDVDKLDIENPEKFTFITSETGETVFHQTANYLEYLLELADCIISRCKQIAINKDSGIHTTEKTTGNVAECESNLCFLLGHVVNISSELARSSFEPGLALDHLMKLLTRIYGTVGILAKYFFVKCKSSKLSVRVAKFDRLVQLIGKILTQNAYNLITYVQTKQQQKDDDANKGKKQHLLLAKSRAIKDGKTIPNLVFKIEAFERDIIKLSKRCNIDLFGDQYPKISTSRDFRVKEINKDAAATGTEHTTQQNCNDDAEMVNDSDTSVSNEDENEKENLTGEEHDAESTRIQTQIISQQNAMRSQIGQPSVLKAGNLDSFTKNPDQQRAKKKMKTKLHF